MSEKIKPALTAEEWADKRIGYGNGDALNDQGCEGHGYHVTPEGVLRYEIGYEGCDRSEDIENPHAIAALALYGQSFGFTREDVKVLRRMARASDLGPFPFDDFDPACVTEQDREDAEKLPRWYNSLADRIESLLPPEK